MPSDTIPVTMPAKPNPAHQAKPETALTDEIRAFIASCFGQHMGPQPVADAVKEVFGKEISRQIANRYNPESMAGRKMATKWKKIFQTARDRYHENLEAYPISRKDVRIAKYQHQYDQAEREGKRGECREILDAVSKEMGGANTNERKVHHSGKIETDPPMSAEEKRNFVLDRLLEAMETARPNAPGTGTTQ